MHSTTPSAAPLPLRRATPLDPPPQCPAHRAARVTPTVLPTGYPAWLVARYADIRSLATDPRISADLGGLGTVNHEPLPDLGPDAPPHITNLDGAAHMRYRQPIGRHFTVRRLRRLTDEITAATTAALDALAAGGPGTDLVETVALRVPCDTICRLFGLPPDDQGTFRDLATLALGGAAKTREEAREAAPRVFGYLAKVVRDKQDNPDDALFSDLVHGGHGFTEQEVLTLSGTLLVAGFDTTAHMIALGALALMRHRAQWDLLGAEPDRADAAVDELMRYLTVMHRGILRRATADIAVGDTVIPAGDLVLFYLPAGNRDPELVTDPDTLDITRKPVRHLGFGYGTHQCIGQQLARLELKIVFTELIRRFPALRPADSEDAVQYSNDTVVYGLRTLRVTW